MKKLNRPSIENLKLIGEILYNFTGNEFYLGLVSNYYQCKAMVLSYRGQFLEVYWENYNLVKKMVNEGKTFEFPLFKIGSTQPKPYIYNSL